MDDSRFPSDVLIVEDNFIIALDTEMMLQDIGVAHVRTVGNAEDALAAINERAPDFALVDVDLGRESGYDVASILVQRGIRFVFATGYAELKSPPEVFAAAPVISKPYTSEMLRAALKTSM